MSGSVNPRLGISFSQHPDGLSAFVLPGDQWNLGGSEQPNAGVRRITDLAIMHRLGKSAVLLVDRSLFHQTV